MSRKYLGKMERTFDVNFLLKDADPAAGLLLALCAGVYAKNQRAFPRRTASLLTTITNGIPVGDAPQVQLIHAPPHACRHFRKLLAYDIRHSALFAIALLPDAGPTSVALHVTSILAKNMTKAKKIVQLHALADARVGRSDEPMPALPAQCTGRRPTLFSS